jgi:hypothetical protein
MAAVHAAARINHEIAIFNLVSSEGAYPSCGTALVSAGVAGMAMA